ncbi:MAG: extracellular solute-binding protein [Candidatus Asgardarchaeia archaeon]
MFPSKSSAKMAFLVGLIIGIIIGLSIANFFLVPSAPGNIIELTVVYSSEKQGWIEEVTPYFLNWWKEHIKDYQIKVNFKPLGSKESLIDIITGAIKPVVWSPASHIWIPILNYMWQKEYSTDTLIAKPGYWNSTVLSPIVIAVWENFAREYNITGFKSLYTLAKKNPSALKYAHTNPNLSNSGFMAVLLQLVAATGKPMKDITIDMLKNESVKEWFRTLESTAVYYGSSTGFLMRHAVETGPSGLNAMVVYENLVLEQNLAGEPLSRWGQRIIAIYPEEGTINNDHPFVILNAPWVTDLQKWAARKLIEYLLSDEAQKLAMKHGFRPANNSVQLDLHYFNEAFGISANISVPFQEPPTDVEVLIRAPDLWTVTKAGG